MYQDSENDYSHCQHSEITPVDWEDFPQQTRKKKHRSGGKIIALALCCSLIGGIAGAGAMYLVTSNAEDPEISLQSQSSNMLEGVRENAIIEISEIETDKAMTAAEVYALNVHSTVGITTSITTNYWGYQTTSAASGSGFILTDDGYILTNYHVIENSNSITVSLYDGKSYEAELIGYDESNDIAVLKIDGKNLPPVILGDSDNLNVGDNVIAIGNPLGELTFSLTAGTISAKDRQITMATGATMNLLQTDCAINSGNSGGALFNMYGEVIGITNAKYSSSSYSEASIDNIGFAIPINHIREIVTSIIEKGYITKPYIGVSVTDVSSDAQRYGLPQGAAIAGIVEDSPAAKAGLQENDIITEVNGSPITGSSDLISTVRKTPIGDTLQLKIFRQGQYLDVDLTVGEQIQAALENDRSSNTESGSSFPWGGYFPGF